ncbi:MAG: UDP-glucose 4-epimerase GalE [Alistipes sp.]|jgi:UDP-glucose 4-epimerase|nr:UDP-glucose 4-epimerase GalE [Alistipes sp.]
MKKTVLVTGGAGYIGSHTAVELIEAGYRVVIADNLSNSELGAVEGVRRITGVDVPFEMVDCNDPAAMAGLFAKYTIDAVIHFAAFKAVGDSVFEPLKYYANNVGSLVTLLETMRAAGVANIVFSSSATVYGQPDVLPATEDTPRLPATSPYGATKQICEDILNDSVAAYSAGGPVDGARGGFGSGLRSIALRYFNPIGAHPSALIGELPRGVPSNLVPFITQTAAGIRTELSIFGDDYDTPDGTALRDFIDVVDLAKAHVVAVGRMISGSQRTPYEVFNIGTGRSVSVMELVKGFERVNGVAVPHKIVGRRAGDIQALWADPSLAAEVLGWRSDRPLDETLRSAWAWQKQLGK